MSEKRQATRDRIIDAAQQLFYHQGFGVTSYAEIARRTEIAKGNLQYHFKAKNELLDAVIERRSQGIRALLEEWSMECDTPYNCIERFIAMVEENAEELARYGCPMGTLTDELGKESPELQQGARRMFDLFLRWIEARFRALMPADEAQAHARQLMAMAQGASVLAHVYNDPTIVHDQATRMREWLESVCQPK
jgi:AcrR family transcriptional regulator